MISGQASTNLLKSPVARLGENTATCCLEDLHGGRRVVLSYHRDLTAEILEQGAVIRGLAALDRRVIRVMGDCEEAVHGSHRLIYSRENRFLERAELISS